MEVSVSEIHRYPLRPSGYVEPLFATEESRREIAEHLLGAPWLSRASEMPGKSGSAVHSAQEPIRLLRQAGGRVEIVRPRARRCVNGHPSRCASGRPWRRRRVVEVLARWREVRSWWSEEERVDRILFRVVVDGGGIIDLALERSGPRSGEWTITGIVD